MTVFTKTATSADASGARTYLGEVCSSLSFFCSGRRVTTGEANALRFHKLSTSLEGIFSRTQFSLLGGGVGVKSYKMLLPTVTGLSLS